MKQFELIKKSKKTKISITIDENVKSDLMKYIIKEAKKQENNLTLSFVVNEVLKNYLEYLKENNKSLRKSLEDK